MRACAAPKDLPSTVQAVAWIDNDPSVIEARAEALRWSYRLLIDAHLPSAI